MAWADLMSMSASVEPASPQPATNMITATVPVMRLILGP